MTTAERRQQAEDLGLEGHDAESFIAFHAAEDAKAAPVVDVVSVSAPPPMMAGERAPHRSAPAGAPVHTNAPPPMMAVPVTHHAVRPAPRFVMEPVDIVGGTPIASQADSNIVEPPMMGVGGDYGVGRNVVQTSPVGRAVRAVETRMTPAPASKPVAVAPPVVIVRPTQHNPRPAATAPAPVSNPALDDAIDFLTSQGIDESEVKQAAATPEGQQLLIRRAAKYKAYLDTQPAQ